MILKRPENECKLICMKRRELKAFAYIAPALVMALLFSYLPLIRSFISSFLTISQSGQIRGFAGFGNYIRLFSDDAFIRSIGHTIIFTLLFVPLNTVLTTAAAALTRRKRKMSPVAEFIFLSPMAVSLSAYAIVFSEMFRGRISIINRMFSTDIAWLESPGTAMLVLVILGVFLDFGIDYILLLSAFRSIDKDVIDAARLDGAGPMQSLFLIELPMIKPMLSATVFMAIKDALLISAPVMVLTEGGPFRSTETVMYYYYLEAFRSGNRAVESTIATLSVSISIAAMAAISLRRRHARKDF